MIELRARLLAAVASGMLAGCPAERRVEPPPPIEPGDPDPVPGPVPAPVPEQRCDNGEVKEHCRAPHTPPQLGQLPPDPSYSGYDANGCIPQDVVGDACSGIRALTGATLKAEGCCYTVCAGLPAPCGRPLLVAGEARQAPLAPRADWSDAPALVMADERLAAAWLADARAEHASVASFARFALELMAVGAPPSFVERAQRAGLDELRHARACFTLARAYGAPPVGPGALPLGGVALGAGLEALVDATVREGCVGETIAAALLLRQAERATPELGAVLASIARDEAEHAELAWAVVAWALALEPRLAATAARAFDEEAARFAEPPEDDDPENGRIGGAAWCTVVAAALAEVVAPARAALGAS